MKELLLKLPRQIIEWLFDMLNMLAGFCVVWNIDFKSGDYQICIRPAGECKTTFKAQDDLFE